MFEKLRFIWWVIRNYPNCSIIHNFDVSGTVTKKADVAYISHNDFGKRGHLR